MISAELYRAICEAEDAARRAHDLCYAEGGKHEAGFWLSIRLGKCQSILMHYRVHYAQFFTLRPSERPKPDELRRRRWWEA